MHNLTIMLIMMVATLGPCLVIGAVGYASMMALGRNPSSAPKIQTSMILAFIFAEAVAVIALMVIFHLFVK